MSATPSNIFNYFYYSMSTSSSIVVLYIDYEYYGINEGQK